MLPLRHSKHHFKFLPSWYWCDWQGREWMSLPPRQRGQFCSLWFGQDSSSRSPYIRANAFLLCRSRAPDSSVLQDQTRIYLHVETHKPEMNQKDDTLIMDSESLSKIWQKWCLCFWILKQVALSTAHDVPSLQTEQSLYLCLGQRENLIGQTYLLMSLPLSCLALFYWGTGLTHSISFRFPADPHTLGWRCSASSLIVFYHI